MSLSLFEIDARLNKLLIDAEIEAEQSEGVIPESMASELDALEMEKEEKAINVVRFIKNLSAEEAAVSAEADRLYKRAKSLSNRMTFLKSYVAAVMPGWKHKDGTCTVSWRKSERVEIVDDSKIPDVFKHTVTEVKIDKLAIKSALKNGEVEGAKLVESQNIQIK